MRSEFVASFVPPLKPVGVELETRIRKLATQA
jgi:hypothetical protein